MSFEIDTLLNGAGKQYYIVFSDRTDIIASHTLAQAENIAADSYPDCIVIGGLDSRVQAIRCRDILIAENVPKERLQERLEQLIVGECSSNEPYAPYPLHSPSRMYMPNPYINVISCVTTETVMVSSSIFYKTDEVYLFRSETASVKLYEGHFQSVCKQIRSALPDAS